MSDLFNTLSDQLTAIDTKLTTDIAAKDAVITKLQSDLAAAEANGITADELAALNTQLAALLAKV